MKHKTKTMTRLLVLVLVAVVAPIMVRAQQGANDVPKIAFQKYTLSNGLEVILSEDHRLPLVAVNLWYHVGPANEEPGRTGFAHLFEHMMFQGSKHVPGEPFKLLEGVGGRDLNGTTDFDRTNYFETVPSNELELALWLESDRMGFLIDQIDQAQLSNQQDVVRNERRQSVENQPYGMVEEAMFHLLFPPGHPYYASVIGSHADIQAASLADVKQFFKLYYAPNNASLAIVGAIDPVATRALVQKYFGSLKRGAPVPRIAVKTPPITSERRAVVQDRVDLPRVYLSWITSPIFADGDADLDVASRILAEGRSSRLYKSLVYEKQIAQNVSADQYSLMLGSVFGIDAIARPGHTAQELEAALDEELERLRREGPSQREIDRVVNTRETAIFRGLEQLGGGGGVANRLNMYNQFLGTPDGLPREIANLRKVSPASVQRAVQAQLTKSSRVVLHGVPGQPDLGPQVPTPGKAGGEGEGAESVNPDEPWRNDRPRSAPLRPARIGAPERFQLPNGLTVLLAERPGVPVVTASLAVRTGSGANPPGKPGLASLAVDMLNQGTSTRSALQLADDLAQIGATLNTNSSMDASTLTVGSLRRNFPAALSLLADVTLRPSFPAEELERQRTARLANLVQQRSNSGNAANAAMAAALYGPNHPYGFPEVGTTASIKAINREELQSFWKQHFVPGNAALIVAGSINSAELRKLVQGAFGGWAGVASSGVAPGVPATTGARLVFVDRPGAPQTQLRVASIGVPRSSPDYMRLRVMNGILGGLFSSRINMNLREEHGYTYGANSQFIFRRGAGPFLVASGVRTDVTAPAVSEIFKEVEKIVQTPVTPDELTMVKDNIARSFPSDFETSARTANSLSTLFVYGLPLDYYGTLAERALAVTAADVQDVARRYLVLEKLVVVAVGDRSRIGPELEALRSGPVELRDPEGALIER